MCTGYEIFECLVYDHLLICHRTMLKDVTFMSCFIQIDVLSVDHTFCLDKDLNNLDC